MNRRSPDPDLIRPLTEAEKLCLSCTLPECNERDPRCAYRQATDLSRRRTYLREYMRRRRAKQEGQDHGDEGKTDPSPHKPSGTPSPTGRLADDAP